MDDLIKYNLAKEIAQSVLRCWNGGGFGEHYFKTEKGKKIIETVLNKL
jgi:hypothetical protein